VIDLVQHSSATVRGSAEFQFSVPNKTRVNFERKPIDEFSSSICRVTQVILVDRRRVRGLSCCVSWLRGGERIQASLFMTLIAAGELTIAIKKETKRQFAYLLKEIERI
jgi:hypothetical protein